MDRLEAQRRIFNAASVLMRRGWKAESVDNLLKGRPIDEAVMVIEREADHGVGHA